MDIGQSLRNLKGRRKWIKVMKMNTRKIMRLLKVKTPPLGLEQVQNMRERVSCLTSTPSQTTQGHCTEVCAFHTIGHSLANTGKDFSAVFFVFGAKFKLFIFQIQDGNLYQDMEGVVSTSNQDSSP